MTSLLEYVQANLITKIIFYGACFMVAALVLLYFYQDKMLYIPVMTPMTRLMVDNPKGHRCPSERELPFEEVNITAEDGIKLHGWLVLQEESNRAPTFVFFHENAGNIGTRLDFIQKMYKNLKCNFLLIAYRGYSHSEGFPSEEGIKKDGHAIMEYAFSRSDVIDTSNIFVLGRSLGGAVAIHTLASADYKVKGVILENTFTSIDEMVDKIFHSSLSFFKNLILRNHWRSVDLIQNLTMPILFMVAEHDELVPPQMSDVLFKKAVNSEKKTTFIMKNAGHNGSYSTDPDTYFYELSKFVKACR